MAWRSRSCTFAPRHLPPLSTTPSATLSFEAPLSDDAAIDGSAVALSGANVLAAGRRRASLATAPTRRHTIGIGTVDAASTVNVPPELTCPLCLELLYSAVLTPCSHTFCKACIVLAQRKGLTSCPLCRAGFDGADMAETCADVDAIHRITATMPAELLANRRREASRMLPDVMREDAQHLKVLVGNRWVPKKAGDERKKWTMYVELLGKPKNAALGVIKHVDYKLDTFFDPCDVSAYPPAFTPRAENYWVFRPWPRPPLPQPEFKVTCQIHWHPKMNMPPTIIRHDLVFEATGGRTLAKVKVKPRCLAAVDC